MTKSEALTRVRDLVARVKRLHQASHWMNEVVEDFERDLLELETELAKEIDDYMNRKYFKYNLDKRLATQQSGRGILTGIWSTGRTVKRSA